MPLQLSYCGVVFCTCFFLGGVLYYADSGWSNWHFPFMSFLSCFHITFYLMSFATVLSLTTYCFSHYKRLPVEPHCSSNPMMTLRHINRIFELYIYYMIMVSFHVNWGLSSVLWLVNFLKDPGQEEFLNYITCRQQHLQTMQVQNFHTFAKHNIFIL